jgi:hypothetical protein
LDTVVAYAFTHFHACEPSTPTRLVSFVLEEVHIPITPDTLRKVLLGSEPLKPVIGKLSEFGRVHISSQIISDYLLALIKLLGIVPPGFLWNMNELGRAD